MRWGAHTIATMLPHESVRRRIEEREERFAPAAVRSARSRGRERPELPSPLRTKFQRDRDDGIT